jgi:hypothetical protein
MVIVSFGGWWCVCVLQQFLFMNLDPFVLLHVAVSVVLSRSFLILCGQVFKGTRWMPWH